MNKKSLRIAGWALGLSMAVAGVGAAVVTASVSSNEPIMVKADTTVSLIASGLGIGNGKAWTGTTVSPVTFGTAGTGSNPAAYYTTGSGLRLYNGDEFTLSITSEYNITGATFTFSGSGYSFSSTDIEATGGDYSEDSGEGTLSNVSSRNISIPVARTCRLQRVDVTYASASISKPITAISSVSLNRSSVPENYSGSLTATAAFTPDDTDELISWASSDEDVATIASTAVNGVGLITIKGEGKCHFTASNSSGSITRDSGDFTVTEAVAIPFYKVTFGTQASDDNTALDASAAEAFMRGDTSGVSVTTATKLYKGAGNSLKFGSSSDKGILSVTTDATVKSVILEAKTFGTDTLSIVPTLGKVSEAATALTSEFKYYAFNFDTASDSFTITSQNSSKNRFYIHSMYFVLSGNAAVEGALSFSAELLNDTAAGCAAKSASTLATAWSTLSTAYDTTESSFAGSKAYFKAADSDEGGTLVEQAAARYDYIVGKYLKTLGNPSFTDFADRDPEAVSGLALSSPFNSTSDSNLPPIITVVAIGAVAAAGVFLFSRRRRDEK